MFGTNFWRPFGFPSPALYGTGPLPQHAASLAALSVVTDNLVSDTLQLSIEAMATYNTCGWSYQYSQYGNTMTSTTKVMIGGAAEDGGALGAFVGDECRGIQSTVSKPPFGPVRCAAPNTCHSPTQPLMLDLFLLFRVRRTASSQCTR